MYRKFDIFPISRRLNMEHRIILIFVVVSCVVRLVVGQEIWTKRSPWISCSSLNGITYVNGKYVAVGSGGAIVISSDGISWANQVSGSRNDLYAITYAGNQFIAAGSAGTILTSPDGATWTQRESGTENRLVKLAYGNNLFVVVGDSGTTLVSADGVSWSRQSLRSSLFRNVIFGNNIFIALVNDGGILTSPDGVTWTSSVSGYFYNICYADNRFIAVGSDSNSASSDGIIWTKSKGGFNVGPGQVNDLIYANHQFVAVGYQQPTNSLNSTIYTSSDGEIWTKYLGGGRNYSVAYGINGFVVVGAFTGRLTIPLACQIFTSIDGAHWTTLTSGGHPSFSSVIYCDKLSDNPTGQFIAVGPPIYTSLDGIFWTENQADQSDVLNCLTHGANILVGAGELGIYISPDLKNWTKKYAGFPINSIAYGQNKFIAVGSFSPFSYSDTILTSSDGITWTKISTGSSISSVKSAVAFTGNQFIAVNGNSIFTSPDGTIWTGRTSGTDNSLNNIAYTSTMPTGQAGRIILVGTKGTILSSTDGVDWEKQTSGTTCSFFGVTYGNNNFVAVGDSGTILSSPDGSKWTAQNSGTVFPLNGICFANDLFVAVGENIILTSSSTATSIFSSGPGSRYPYGIKSIGNNLFYTLPATGAVSIKLYDLRGRCLKSLVNSMQSIGPHMATLPCGLSPGAYILSFQADHVEAVKIFSSGK
jgi:photosystem II stability/assembly factor-like uncharacterized protein